MTKAGAACDRAAHVPEHPATSRATQKDSVSPARMLSRHLGKLPSMTVERCPAPRSDDEARSDGADTWDRASVTVADVPDGHAPFAVLQIQQRPSHAACWREGLAALARR